MNSHTTDYNVPNLFWQNTESLDLDAEVSAAKKIKKVEDDEEEDEQVDSGLDSETEVKKK